MRAMEHPPVAKQTHTNPGTLSLACFRTQLGEQRFDVSPRDVAAGWMAEDRDEGPAVPSFHNAMVPRNDTAMSSCRQEFTFRLVVRARHAADVRFP